MSNIRGIGDFEPAGPPRGQAAQQGGGYNYDAGGGQMGIGLTPPSPYGQIPSISERLVPRFSKRSATLALSVFEAIMLVVTLIYAGVTYTEKRGGVFFPGNENAGPSAYVLYDMGASYGESIRGGQVWRLVTPIFLHAGIKHLLSNLFFQLHFGFTLETRWGTKRFCMIYLATGLGASLLSVAASYCTVSVGASGALFGLLGANIAYLAMNWVDIPQNSAELCVMVMVIVINFMLGSAPESNVDNFAHLGGLVTGFFCGCVLCPPVNERPNTKMFQLGGLGLWFIWVVALVLVIFLVYPAPAEVGYDPQHCGLPK